jgi:hypothetical protein
MDYKDTCKCDSHGLQNRRIKTPYAHSYYNQDWYQNSPYIYPITNTPYEMRYIEKRKEGHHIIDPRRKLYEQVLYK